MLVRTTYNISVDIVSAEGATLQSREGTVWHRRGDLDEPDHAAYCSSPDGAGSVIQLGKSDLVRICKGIRAIQTPTTVEELRAATMDFDSEAYALANEKPDQWFREVLIKAEDTNQNPASLAGRLLCSEVERNKPVEEPKETPAEATEKPSSPPKRVTKGRRTPRAKLQPGGFEGTFEGNRVLLTPKQVEFMERIDEIGESYQTEDGVWYPTDIYTECLSDTMSPMSVGAVITTLREKGAIETEYCRMAGRKVCKFRLTAVGQYVYDNLRSGKVH